MMGYGRASYRAWETCVLAAALCTHPLLATTYILGPGYYLNDHIRPAPSSLRTTTSIPEEVPSEITFPSLLRKSRFEGRRGPCRTGGSTNRVSRARLTLWLAFRRDLWRPECG